MLCSFDLFSITLLTTSRMPIIDKFKDMGTVVMGKIESGSVREGDSLLIMPNKVLFLSKGMVEFIHFHGSFPV